MVYVMGAYKVIERTKFKKKGEIIEFSVPFILFICKCK
jgi:hypothetical protein